MRISLLFLAMFIFTACSAPLQGPSVDLATLATPDPTPDLVRQLPPSLPPTTPGRFRAWVLRSVSPEGDLSEGYWLDLSTAPPVITAIEPAKLIPRAPKQPLVKPAAAKPTPALASTPQPPTLPAISQQPSFPLGRLPQGSSLP